MSLPTCLPMSLHSPPLSSASVIQTAKNDELLSELNTGNRLHPVHRGNSNLSWVATDTERH